MDRQKWVGWIRERCRGRFLWHEIAEGLSEPQVQARLDRVPTYRGLSRCVLREGEHPERLPTAEPVEPVEPIEPPPYEEPCLD